jgi:enoyl-CoA hydratase
MSYENILTETHERVGIVRLNRPKVLNALNSDLMRELGDALAAFDSDPSIGCLLITGSERAFAAGADIKEMASASSVDMLTRDHIGSWDRIAKMRKPLIAVVAGYAFGGGCELAMMCDMIFAASTAVFGQPEINLGVMPGAGGTQRLVRSVGKSMAMEMILNDRHLSADEALACGLVSRVFPEETYWAESLKLAAQIAGRAQLGLQLAKESVNKAYEMTLAEGLTFERRNFYFLFSTEDQKEGMDAFVNKRKPEWKGK